MTDEERQKLVAALRSDTFTLEMNYQAADELEWLEGQLQTILVMYGQKDKEIERLAALVQSAKEDCDLRMLNAVLHADDRG